MKMVKRLCILIASISLNGIGQTNFICQNDMAFTLGCKRVFVNKSLNVKANRFNYFIFSENAFPTLNKKLKIAVDNGYTVNAYGTLKIEESELLMAYGTDFNVSVVEVVLKEPLIKDEIYVFSMKISLAQSSSYFLNKIPICFSDSSNIKYAKPGHFYFLGNDKNRKEINFINTENQDKYSWNLIKLNYRAIGGEKYIQIGGKGFKNKNKDKSFSYLDDFENRENILNRNKERYKKSIFYYMKNFSLTTASTIIDSSECWLNTLRYEGFRGLLRISFKNPDFFELNKLIALNGIEFNDSILNLKSSLPYLNHFRNSILYTFNSSVIQFTLQSERSTEFGMQKLKSLKSYFSENFYIDPQRIKLKIISISDDINLELKLAFEILSF